MPARPSRLPPAPEFAREAVPAVARRTHAATQLVVRLTGIVDALRANGFGVATYDAQTGADFAWTPIEAAVADADGTMTLSASTHVRGELMVSFAAAPAFARHGYLARVTVAADQAPAATVLHVDLPVVIGEVRFALPAGVERAGPLRLSRCDDPHWLPSSHAATGIDLRGDRPTAIVLGAGDYELVDPIDVTRRQRFAAPATEEIRLNPDLAGARGDRP